MASRLHPARLGAAFLGAAVALLASALPASAEATGEVALGNGVAGDRVTINGKHEVTSLIGLRLSDGKVLKTYCVELDVPARDGYPMKEARWEDYPDGGKGFKSQRDKVLWILNHSYPTVDTEALGKVVEAKDLTRGEAIAGTQAAIWHFSNGAKLDDHGNNDDVKKLYSYLTGDKNVGQKEQPPVSLKLDPEKLEGVAGEKIGPFTVDSKANEVKLSLKDGAPEGVQILGADEKPVKTVKGGDKVSVKVPADVKGEAGDVTLHAEAEATVEKGRLFVGSDHGKRTQTLIAAASSQTKTKAEAVAKWKKKTTPTTSSSSVAPSTTPGPSTTPSASQQPSSSVPVTPGPTSSTTPAQPVPVAKNDDLANTGASVLGAIGVGIVLVGGGATALILQRRRKKA